MAKPSGLMRRNGTYYYRVRVPKDLVSVFGRAEVKASLETKDYSEAKRRRNQVAMEWDARFEDARRSHDGAAAAPLSGEQAVQLVQDYVARTDREWRRREIKESPPTADARRDMVVDLATSEQMLSDVDDPRREAEIWLASQELLDRSGFRLGDDSIPYAEFWELVRRALLELYRRSQARLNDDFSATSYDELFAHRPGFNATEGCPSFGSLCDQYLDVYVQEAGGGQVHQQRIDKVRAQLELVREIVGAETPVAAVDYDRCLAFRQTLARVPSRRRQFFGDMPLEDAIAAAEKAGKPTMGYETQAGYLATLTRVLRLGRRKKLMADVPSEGLRPIARKVPPADKRDAFTPEQLQVFFRSDYYLACARQGSRPYLNAAKPSRFWLPLISLFSGMRPKEICQMHVADLKVTDDGLAYFHVIADDGEKTEKTPTSRRKIPVHPELVRMGFLAYAESVRERRHKRLFPELGKNKYGNYSAYVLKRFREKFFPETVELGERQSFYSFRHCFRDALRRIEAPPEILQALGAWSQGKLVSDAYGEGFEVGHLTRYVEKVDYPSLDLSHLYVKEQGGPKESALENAGDLTSGASG